MSDFEKGAEAMRAACVAVAQAEAEDARRECSRSRRDGAHCIEDAIRRVALPLPAPAQQSESREASALDDAIALVEGWWRSKGRALQDTHAPNLASARVDASEVDALIARIRALAPRSTP